MYDLYISKEPTKAWLRRVDLNSGKVTTLAGGVNGSPPQDGLFSTVNFNGFWMGMTVDATDNIYLTDQSYLRKISNVFDASKGNITTIVNAPNLQTNAHSLYSPFYGVDSTGNPVVYFTDAYNKTIRKL